MSDYYKLMNNSSFHLKISLVHIPFTTQAFSKCTNSQRIHIQMLFLLLLYKIHTDVALTDMVYWWN